MLPCAATLRYSIFTSQTGFNEVIPHCSKVLSYILYDGPITWHRIGKEFSYGRWSERQMQRCQYIMGNRHRFDDWGLTETGLSSSISNLFVSAVILTDKQSACNITSTLTECDSASARHEKDGALRVDWEQAEINSQGTVKGNDLPRPHFCTKTL